MGNIKKAKMSKYNTQDFKYDLPSPLSHVQKREVILERMGSYLHPKEQKIVGIMKGAIQLSEETVTHMDMV